MIFVLYGQPGSGKSALSRLLAERIQHHPTGNDPVIIDGDEFRSLYSNNNYDRAGRYQNIRNCIAVSTWLQANEPDRDVIIALVNPYAELRAELKENNAHVVEIHLHTNRELRKEYHVKDFEVGIPDFTLNTNDSEQETFKRLLYMIAKNVPYL